MAAEKVVYLQGDDGLRTELAAGAAIKPGHLIERYDDSGTIKFRVHATAGGSAIPCFADRNHKGGDLEDAYSATDRVHAFYPQPGHVVNTILADGEDIADTDWVESNGNGEMREVDVDASFADFAHSSVIGQAMEALDLSSSSGGSTSSRRLAVRIR